MLPFVKVVFKTYPNKWKKRDTHPDIRGTVECEAPDGTVTLYEYAQWKPGPGKKQTLTVWKLKEDKQTDTNTDSGNQEQAQTSGGPQQKTTAPKQQRQKTEQQVKDDAQDW